ncbi:MAG: PilZ domain-containing protein [Planctomycetota bacterium]
MKQERIQKRRHLLYYLRVYDMASEELLGHLVDITTEGIMLISDRKLETDKLYQLRMEWPMEDGSKGMVKMEAESIWCRNDVNPDFYDTGFRLRNPNPELVKQIGLVIHSLGLND